MLYICYMTHSLCTSGFQNLGWGLRCQAGTGNLCWRSLSGEGWISPRVSVYCCIPNQMHHSWPAQWLQTWLLSLSFLSKCSFCSQEWGLIHDKLLPARGSWAKIRQSTHALAQVKRPSSYILWLKTNQTDDNIQNNDISVTAVTHEPNFKRRLNTVK